MDLGTSQELFEIADQIATGEIPPPNKAQSILLIRAIARIIEQQEKKEKEK